MSKINIKIDGKSFTADSQKTVLQIAQENGINIPTLCHNDQISRNTSCFVCVVKDLKTGRFLPSCSFYPADGQEFASDASEVREMRKTALELLLSEHAGDCEAPCTIACPAHANVEEYVRAGRKGDFLEALKIIKQRIPLPMSIGRVCPRFCEKDCRKNVTDKPVAINDFKRLAADLHYETYIEELPQLSGKRVAVVGAGPAGLATAYFLRMQGVASVIFDKMPKPGGMLRYGIPEYRLPKAILDKELAHFTKIGIEFSCGRKLGENLFLDDLKQEFDAVALTIGCWQPGSMRCEGEELATQGIAWLEKIALNDWQGDNPGKVIVVGGGNTAMDCVRTAVRLGSDDVNCLYRRDEAQMPAERIEIEEAKEEGVKFQFLAAPVKICRNADNKLVVSCVKMELGEPDASGRQRPIPVPNSEYELQADLIIAAVGQKTAAPNGIKTTKWGDLDVHEETYHLEGNIFAAGDCVTGAATVVEGVAGGRKIALSIADYLNGNNSSSERQINVSRGHWQNLAKKDLVYLRQDVSEKTRVDLEFIPLEERKNSFKEVCATVTQEKMMQEGERCFECSCTTKHDCKLRKISQDYGASPTAIKGEKLQVEYDNRHPLIIQDRGKCIKCGICVKICKEVVNANLLGMKERGFRTKVETAFAEPLPLSCKDCGECLKACPVGALDWKIKE